MKEERLSLRELQLIIRDSIYAGLPELLWVTAEISEIKENTSGHTYLELVEKQDGEGNISARIRGTIWGIKGRVIRQFFESTTGETLRSGLRILMRARVEYHEVYGISLNITDIDPSYTIGELAAKKLSIIRRLEADGVIAMNKELALSPVPNRIAIVSSENAAGYNDFLKHLKDNPYGFTFTTMLFGALMQGVETENSVCTALNNIAAMQDKFDVVVIIRGGGSQADLSWFDNYNIAYLVTQFPLPVITGIGHEKDSSVTDMVAFRCEKTPTAAADYIIGKVAESQVLLHDLSERLFEAVQYSIGTTWERVNDAAKRLLPSVRIRVASGYEKTGYLLSRISKGSRYLLLSVQKDLAGLQVKTDLLNPLNIISRGFTLTTKNGKIVCDAKEIEIADIIETHFRDGILKSEVINKKKNE